MSMSYTELVDNSVSYNVVIRLYRLFLLSGFFKLFSNSFYRGRAFVKDAVSKSDALRMARSILATSVAFMGRLKVTKRMRVGLSILNSLYLKSQTYRLLNMKV